MFDDIILLDGSTATAKFNIGDETTSSLLIELIDSDSDWEDCVVTLYNAIIRGEGRSIQKHDITANIDVLLDDDVIIYPGHGPSTTIIDEINENPFLN